MTEKDVETMTDRKWEKMTMQEKVEYTYNNEILGHRVVALKLYNGPEGLTCLFQFESGFVLHAGGIVGMDDYEERKRRQKMTCKHCDAEGCDHTKEECKDKGGNHDD